MSTLARVCVCVHAAGRVFIHTTISHAYVHLPVGMQMHKGRGPRRGHSINMLSAFALASSSPRAQAEVYLQTFSVYAVGALCIVVCVYILAQGATGKE